MSQLATPLRNESATYGRPKKKRRSQSPAFFSVSLVNESNTYREDIL